MNSSDRSCTTSRHRCCRPAWYSSDAAVQLSHFGSRMGWWLLWPCSCWCYHQRCHMSGSWPLPSLSSGCHSRTSWLLWPVAIQNASGSAECCPQHWQQPRNPSPSEEVIRVDLGFLHAEPLGNDVAQLVLGHDLKAVSMLQIILEEVIWISRLMFWGEYTRN